MTEGHTPFRPKRRGRGRVVVRFAATPPRRRPAWDEQLCRLVDEHDAVACDFGGVVNAGSEWFRLLARLTARAKRAGKTLAIVGLGRQLRQTVDVLGLRGKLVLVDKISEVWER